MVRITLVSTALFLLLCGNAFAQEEEPVHEQFTKGMMGQAYSVLDAIESATNPQDWEKLIQPEALIQNAFKEADADYEAFEKIGKKLGHEAYKITHPESE